MFSIDCNKKITITEGDSGYLKIGIPNYVIKENDTIKMSVSNSRIDGNEKKGGYLFQKQAEIENGVGHIRIAPSDTKSAEIGVYLYDVQLTKANGDVYTIVTPRHFEIKGGITNE